MQVRPFIPADAPHLEMLLRQIWGTDPSALKYYRFGPDSPPENPRFFRTVVAEEDGIAVGFGSAWINTFHPHALYVSVNVHPAYRRRGAGARLLAALNAHNTASLPLQGCTWATSVDGIGFLERQGFRAVRLTYESILHIADVDLNAFRDTADRIASHGYSLVSLAELAQAPAPQAKPAELAQAPTHEAKLAALVREVYTATHGINPPRPMDLQGWIDLRREDAPDQAGSFVALHGDQYAAFSTAHAEEPDRLTLGWSGVTEAHRQHERDLILALTLRHISHAVTHGADLLEGEFDSTDPWAMIRLGGFPFRPAPCWLTFQHR